MGEPTVIYVASSSRSGSTLLDQSLGSVEGVFGVGELRRMKDFASCNRGAIQDPSNRLACTCGAMVLDCGFWNAVAQRAGLDLSALSLSSQLNSLNRAIFKLVFLALGVSGVRWLARHYPPFQTEMAVGENCFKIYTAVADVTGSTYIVDSSKVMNQYLILKVVRPDKVKLVALFRDGRAVSKSMIRGERLRAFSQRRGLDNANQAFKAATASWIKGTIQTLLFYSRLAKPERFFVRYEDFCTSPAQYKNAMLRHFGMSDVESRRHVQKANHNIGGSPSRFMYDESKIVLDDAWRGQWSRLDERMFGLAGCILNKILGYK